MIACRSPIYVVRLTGKVDRDTGLGGECQKLIKVWTKTALGID